MSAFFSHRNLGPRRGLAVDPEPVGYGCVAITPLNTESGQMIMLQPNDARALAAMLVMVADACDAEHPASTPASVLVDCICLATCSMGPTPHGHLRPL